MKIVFNSKGEGMNLLINGICGRMGQEILALARKEHTVYGVDRKATSIDGVPCAKGFSEAEKNVDCIIDFSHRSATGEVLAFAVENQLPLVLATTGQTDNERAAVFRAARKIPLFFAANCSLGVVLLIELAKKAAAVLTDAEIEIVETHHDQKADAPSGTALAIFEALKQVRPEAVPVIGRTGAGKRTKEEIGIHSLRMGNAAGDHEVILATPVQTIRLKHEAHNRALYAQGALSAANFLIGKVPGLYTMDDLIHGGVL